jgi:hypothetical protein
MRLILSAAAVLAACSLAPGFAAEAVLPPLRPWDGASRSLAVSPDHPWATPTEVSELTASPSYEETMAWLARLAAQTPDLEIGSIGGSWSGHPIPMVIASALTDKSPEALAADGRPIALVHAGIHAGEIDGKDAGMMLLRDMTVLGTRRDLLEQAHLLFIPILNVDGHERSSPYGRMNQRGPARTGWRTNARNLNLNRDFAKLETPGIRALVAAIERWRPDLHVDLHVTDGVDFQYDITWGYNGPHAGSPAIAGWLDAHLTPAAERALEAAGHVPGPLFFPLDEAHLERGLIEWTAPPRFSHGYGDARHLPSVLVENHSLKPFDQRVLGTRVFLESVLRSLAADHRSLREAVAADRARRPDPLTLDWTLPDSPEETHRLLGIESRQVVSEITGGLVVEWTGRPITRTVPWLTMSVPRASASRPVAYWIPPAWGEIAERLRMHGITVEQWPEARALDVEMYRLSETALVGQDAGIADQANAVFEGRARVRATATLERRRESFPAGSFRVPTDQPLGSLAMLLLEPDSPDSFLQWGYFLEILQRTEYFEAYVMEPTARRMMAEDPELAAAFRAALEDPAFAADPRRRLEWFYEKTPWLDERFRLYPVARETDTPK